MTPNTKFVTMRSIIRNPALKKILLSAAGSPLLKKLNRASTDIKSAQQRILSSIIENARETLFGKEHDFNSIKSIADFRNAVPIRDFEGHRPYIDRMCLGEADILIPGKPLFYNTTSGTTDKPKLIPVSEPYFNTTYSEINRLWLYTCSRDNPDLFQGQTLSAVSPAVEGHVEDGTPYGSISGVIYRHIPKFLRDVHSTPYPVICMKNYQAKYYGMMRCALAASITYIITANPSTLLQFHRTVLENAEALIRDIHDGTLRSDVAGEINPDDRLNVLKGFKKNRLRARQLESIFQTHEGRLLPCHYWPELVCINTWKQGNCSLILPKISGYYPKNTFIREFGYQASELRAGIVLQNDWNSSLLLAHMFLFEFIEASSRSQVAPPVLQAHELEIGKSYYILFSSGSGLYRYDINDIIRVTGFYGEFPLFEFIQKGDGVTSLTGEKLSEVQVIRAIDKASEKSGLDVEFYTMFCDREAFAYKLYIEFLPDANQEAKVRFLDLVDEQLKYYNSEYEVKRASNRLQCPELIEMVPNSYEALKNFLLEEGLVREGQYKVRYLLDDAGMMQRFERLLLKEVPV